LFSEVEETDVILNGVPLGMWDEVVGLEVSVSNLTLLPLLPDPLDFSDPEELVD
jgi:hypothetical protein